MVTLSGDYDFQFLIEVILERVTNISMGASLDAVTEYEALAADAADAPTAIAVMG